MADYQMAEREGALVVSIVGYQGPRLPLLQAMDTCRFDSDAQSLQQVQELEADEHDGRIELRVTPRAGARLDLEGLRRCVESTLERYEGVRV